MPPMLLRVSCVLGRGLLAADVRHVHVMFVMCHVMFVMCTVSATRHGGRRGRAGLVRVEMKAGDGSKQARMHGQVLDEVVTRQV